jgi:hypothetical protein
MHPKIIEQLEQDGWSKDSDVDPDTFADLQRLKFMLSAPVERTAALQHMQNIIAEDDGTSLRSKADLFQLHRKLSATDSQMRKAGK